MPYLDILATPHKAAIRALQSEHAARLAGGKKGFARHRELYEAVRHLKASTLDLAGDVVRIGTAGDIRPEDQPLLLKTLRGFMPWRKGPFSVFGTLVDAEWQSFRKWNRLLPALPDLQGKIIADIGASNGYYMFRMAHHGPRLVVGFEPYLQHYWAFRMLNRFAGLGNLHMEPFGVEQIGLYAGSFDVVFLMGILYHRASPVEVLKDIHKAMQTGGVILVESQGIPGEAPVAFFPEERYAKVPGTYFVPTAACLANWMKRAGFENVTVFCTHPMSSEEQRRTEWMTFESYADFIDPADPDRTVEGYPAPLRIFARGEK